MANAKPARASITASVLFSAGCAIALGFSARQLAPVWDRFRLIPQIVASQSNVLEYSCRDGDCVRCISGLAASARALVLTSGSSFRTGLDVASFTDAMPFEVVDCMRNDSRVDAYRLFFSHAPVMQREQTILHGYNSWSINSPGTWRHANADSFFVTSSAASARRMAPTLGDQFEQYRLYANIFVVTILSGSSRDWRLSLRHRVPAFERWDGSYWPLTRDAHMRRRLGLMKRWFNLSPYVRSFVIEADRPQPPEEIASRHEAFMQAAAPVTRFIFASSPELSEVFPESLRSVIAQSRAVLLETLSRHPGVRHVEVDYRACGLGPADFWSEDRMSFDVAHPEAQARPKITRCLVEELRRLNIADFVAAP